MGDLDWSNGNIRMYFALVVLFAVLTTVTVGLRFYAIRVRRGRPAVDDWMVLSALGFYYCELGVHLWPFFDGGYYKHMDEVTQEQLTVIFKQLTVIQYPYPFVLTLTRTSVCILLLRIFVLKWIKRALYIAIFLNVSWGLFLILDAFLVCRPFAFNWDPTIPGGVCGNKEAGYMANAIWGIANDAFIWSLPHFVVWKLNTTTARKIALTLVFMLGLLDISIAIVRIAILVNLKVDGEISYLLPPVQILSFVESGVAIIVASLMVCRPVFERFLPLGRSLSTSDTVNTPLREKRSVSDEDHDKSRLSSAAIQPFPIYGKTQIVYTGRDTASTLPELSANDILVTRDFHVTRNLSDSDFTSSVPGERRSAPSAMPADV